MVRLLDYVLQGPGFKPRYSIMSLFHDSIQHLVLEFPGNSSSCILVQFLFFDLLLSCVSCPLPSTSLGRDSLFFFSSKVNTTVVIMEPVSREKYMRVLSKLDCLSTKFIALEQENQRLVTHLEQVSTNKIQQHTELSQPLQVNTPVPALIAAKNELMMCSIRPGRECGC
jgi:hypothetical protein